MKLLAWLGVRRAGPVQPTYPKGVEVEEPVSLQATRFGGRCRIGRYTYVSRSALIAEADIGRFCSIGQDAIIGPAIHPVDRLSTHPFTYSPKTKKFPTAQYAAMVPREKGPDRLRTVIGNDVWIGTRSIILEGISVGDGAVVGAGSVVTRDVPPYSIVAGAPAILRRKRFSDDVVARLLALKWWEYEFTREDLGDPEDPIELVLERLEQLKRAGKLKASK